MAKKKVRRVFDSRFIVGLHGTQTSVKHFVQKWAKYEGGLLNSIRSWLDSSVKSQVDSMLQYGHINGSTAKDIVFLQWCEHWLTT
jgi:hypothetical protein